MGTLGTRLLRWLSERYPVDDIRGFLQKQSGKPLPPHTSWWHTLGSLLLFLTANQIVTGVLLMVYYRPSPETAFESLHHIMTRTHFGWFIRGLHAWGANVMILLLVAHMFRTFVMGTYKKPRELTWTTGVLIFGTVLTFGFTGYLLPWNQVAYWATTVGTEITGAIPLIGEPIKTLLRGGDAVGSETLARFYVVHVAVLPWILTGLVAIHLLLVRLHGLAPLTTVGREPRLDPARSLRFYPDHVAKESVVFAVFFTLLSALVVFAPPELGERADPYRSPEGVKPEWYFLPTYQLLKYMPKILGILVSAVPFLMLLLWPFADRSPERDPRKRPWSVSLGAAAFLLALVFGVLGYLSETTVELFGTRVHFDLYGIPRFAAPPASEPPKAAGAPVQVDVKAATEEGEKMLVAMVTRRGKPIEGVKTAFFVEVESELRPLGEDTTIDDGTAAVRFPEGVPGGPQGELRIVVEAKASGELSGGRAEAVFTGGIPVPACPWRPVSPATLAVIGSTAASGLIATALFWLKVRRIRARA